MYLVMTFNMVLCHSLTSCMFTGMCLLDLGTPQIAHQAFARGGMFARSIPRATLVKCIKSEYNYHTGQLNIWYWIMVTIFNRIELLCRLLMLLDKDEWIEIRDC